MEYVMVPVPEEHVAEVRQYLHWNLVKLPSGTWDQEVVEGLLRDVGERGRRLLLLAAEAAREVVVLTVRDAAEAVGCSEHEVLGLVTELYQDVVAVGGPSFALVAALSEASDAEPRTWTLNMTGDVSQLILAAAGRGDESLES